MGCICFFVEPKVCALLFGLSTLLRNIVFPFYYAIVFVFDEAVVRLLIFLYEYAKFTFKVVCHNFSSPCLCIINNNILIV